MVTFASILFCLETGVLPAVIDMKFLEIATHIFGGEVLPLIFVMTAETNYEKQRKSVDWEPYILMLHLLSFPRFV